MTDAELKQKAIECFAANVEHDSYFVTKDGMCFEDKNTALSHNKGVNGLKKEKDLLVVSRESVAKEVAAQADKDKARAEKQIAAMETELDKVQKGEEAVEAIKAANAAKKGKGAGKKDE